MSAAIVEHRVVDLVRDRRFPATRCDTAGELNRPNFELSAPQFGESVGRSALAWILDLRKKKAAEKVIDPPSAANTAKLATKDWDNR